MQVSKRGADIVAQTLARAGVNRIFTLSGNHVMPIFDALLGTDIELVHVRHEAATVHMADAVGRLTGEPGIALVASGQGHTNAVAALTTAQCAEAPLVLLSGHAGLNELGRGAFQEMPQAELARPLTKASWTVRSAKDLGHDIAKAMRMARSGRPGPVHVSLPVDLLDAQVDDVAALLPQASAFAREIKPLDPTMGSAVLTRLRAAQRPLILAGPSLCTRRGRAQLAALQKATGIPAIGMESPRGINDPLLGAFAQVLGQADTIVLLGKPHDFTLKFAEPPAVDASACFIVIDPDPDLIARAVREKASRVAASFVADSDLTVEAIIASATAPHAATQWCAQVDAALAFRPSAWAAATAADGTVHPAAMGRAIQDVLVRHPDAVLVVDGGEIGQWAQACTQASRRIINGVAGSIGAALPFALGARSVERDAPVIAVMGDGTFGFHMAEIDTAVRHGLPFVAVVGNDARWNAEHQIQLRQYGPQRAHGCSLLPSRYERVAEALGGHGEYVTRAGDLPAALERAIASRRPAVVNVMIEGRPAPTIRRP